MIPGGGAGEDLASSECRHDVVKSKQENMAGNLQYLSVPAQKRASGAGSSKNNQGRPEDNHHKERGVLSSANH